MLYIFNSLSFLIGMLSFIYFDIVLLVLLLKHSKNKASWIVPILVQILSVNALAMFADEVFDLNFLSSFSHPIKLAIVFLLLALINTLVILALSGSNKPEPEAKKKVKTKKAKAKKNGDAELQAVSTDENAEQGICDFEFFDSDVTLDDMFPEASEVELQPEKDIKSQDAEAIELSSDAPNDETVSEINNMLAHGRKEDALKYLRMLAFFASDQSLRDYASNKLKELSEDNNESNN